MDQTTPNYRNGTVVVAGVFSVWLLVGIGTGGNYTYDYHALKVAKLAVSKARDTAAKQPALALDIEHIRNSLKITMSELAYCIGVSRQAPYQWIRGGSIKEGHLAPLESLRRAADVISAANLPERPLLLQRKLAGGRTLLEAIASGEDGKSAALSLVEMLKAEDAQRRELAKFFPKGSTASGAKA